MDSGLFLPDEDVSKIRMVEGVINREEGASGVPENNLYPLLLENPHQGFCT
jgi:hypothetical protein